LSVEQNESHFSSFFLATCVSLPTKETAQGAIAIEVDLYPPLNLSQRPHLVYFLRVLPGRFFTESNRIYVSNYSVDNRFYLFGAEPGFFVVVGAMYNLQPNYTSASTEIVKPRESDTMVFFSEELAKATLAELKRDKVIFIGKLKVDMSLSLSEADPFQKFVSNLLKPTALEPKSLFETFLNSQYTYLGSIRSFQNDEDIQAHFKKIAEKKDLQDSEWVDGL
jgi:hypothetical protein